MPWSDIIGQTRATGALKRAVEADRVAHAYMFVGPTGVGKTATALEFAKALQCERGEGEACGRCLACTKSSRLIHPDIHVLFPVPKETSEKEIGERIAALAADPYAVVDFSRRPSLDDPEKTSNKQVQYHIASVHEDLLRPMSFRPAEGRYKIAILTDAHLMRREASNAFLKLLEEPAPQTVFILITDRVERLLPTIISRCQQIRFDPLTAEQIEQALIARDGRDPDEASVLARMANGSYPSAREMADGTEVGRHRELVVNFLRQSFANKIDDLAKTNGEFSSGGRERLKGLLSLLEMWIRDLVLYRAMGDDAPLVNIDQAEVVGNFCTNLPDARLDEMVALVEEARMLVERNVTVSLLLIALSHALRNAMHGRPAPRLYVPLTEASSAAA